ncbi:MAG: DedA family protein [Syntrophomonadaceae bacterium]|nr:DedA family protein [Syntrophomonadaceae bacterium]MDD3023379.1 DedA family protein [Syntrophomonadaceae bacterium]
MTYEWLFDLIQQFGYFALFFALWLGIVGMPVPDEAIVMTGGLVTALGFLAPIPAFFITYLGVVSGLTLGYILGKQFGSVVLKHTGLKKKTAPYLSKAHSMLIKYGHYALVFSYYLPVVRHLVPYLVGIGKMPYHKYALYSYSSGFLWTLIYFLAGRFFGNHIEQIVQQTREYGWYLLILITIGYIAFYIYHSTKKIPGLQESYQGTKKAL